MEKDTATNQIKNECELKRKELLDLYLHYEAVIKDELDFFFKYFNFYITLFSALLAGTLTGLLALKQINYLELIFLLGPSLVFVLSFIGFYNIRVYYRRFAEAVVTVINIKSMLKLNKKSEVEAGILAPIFPSKYGEGFIAQFDRPKIKKIFEEAENKSKFAEDVLNKLLKHGDTLKYARYTLVGFRVASFILFMFIICHYVWH